MVNIKFFRNMSSIYSSNSEAFASELLEYIEEMCREHMTHCLLYFLNFSDHIRVVWFLLFFFRPFLVMVAQMMSVDWLEDLMVFMRTRMDTTIFYSHSLSYGIDRQIQAQINFLYKWRFFFKEWGHLERILHSI